MHGAFSRCQVLRAVTAPGCKHFGAEVFEECCSLTQIGTTQYPGNALAPQAQLRPRVFQGCTALRHLNLGMSECGPAYPNRCLPDCCFLEGGIVALSLPPDFNRIGSAACASCQQLQTVDLSQTDVIEILGSTFAHCSQLQQLSLSRISFFHEYGRRVGMVPRSSLKGGKNSLMVEKITRTTTTTQKPQPKAHRPSLHHHVVFPLC